MDGGPLFPIAVKDASFVPPDADAYYVLAQNGLFLVRRTPFFFATVPVDGGVPGLRDHTANLVLTLPPLPRPLLERAMGFFQAVWARAEGEAILIIFYAPELGRFALVAPLQILTGRVERGRFRADLRLTYGACENPGPQFFRIGSIHSHGCLGPQHSTIDVDDEVHEPGLHVTAGYVHSARPEFAAAFVVGCTRFAVPVDRVLPEFRGARRPPAAWLERVVLTCKRLPLGPGRIYDGHGRDPD